MSLFLTIVGILVGVITFVLVLASMKPDVTVIERKREIEASPDVLRPYFANLRKWQEWSPYEGLDANLKRSYEGPEGEVGSSYAWQGNKQAGSGTMRVTEIDEKGVHLDVHFKEPFESAAVAHFILEPSYEPDSNKTTTTWRMEMKTPLMSKVIGLFINMDNLIGKDFARGLENLARTVEPQA